MSIMAAHRPKIHDNVDVLILPGRLLYWEPAVQKFVGNYEGIFTVSTYADGDKARVAFKPSRTESASLHSETIVNFCELKEGFNAEIHHGLAMRLMEGTKKKNAVTFGKCASMTHTNADGKALKTLWVARFHHKWQAANFLIVLNYLKDCKMKAKEAADKEAAAKQAAAKEAASLMETLKITTSDATSSGATGGETEDSSLAGASHSSVDYLQSPTLSDYADTDTEEECFVAESQASFFPPRRRK
jgi:hypothetical protein